MHIGNEAVLDALKDRGKQSEGEVCLQDGCGYCTNEWHRIEKLVG